MGRGRRNQPRRRGSVFAPAVAAASCAVVFGAAVPAGAVIAPPAEAMPEAAPHEGGAAASAAVHAAHAEAWLAAGRIAGYLQWHREAAAALNAPALRTAALGSLPDMRRRGAASSAARRGAVPR